MDTRQQLQQRLIAAALDLAEATGSHAFAIPVPNTKPQLYVSLHEGPVQMRAAEDRAKPS